MPKSIKLEEKVHKDLDDIRYRRETFSQAVERLIKLRNKVYDLERLVGGRYSTTEYLPAPKVSGGV